MNFEVIDNCFQILVLWCAALTATGLSIRYRERRFLILALAYACFSMGTLYWVLYLPSSRYVSPGLLRGRDFLAGRLISSICRCRVSGQNICPSISPRCRHCSAVWSLWQL